MKLGRNSNELCNPQMIVPFSIQRIPMYVLFSSSSTFLLHTFYKGNFWNHYMEYWSMEHATFIHMLWHRHFLYKRHTFWICILKEFATIISLFDSQRPSRWTFTNTLHNWESIYFLMGKSRTHIQNTFWTLKENINWQSRHSKCYLLKCLKP